MVLKTWPPSNRGYPSYVTPEILAALKGKSNHNDLVPESPLSWTGVEDEPLHIDSDDEKEGTKDYDGVDGCYDAEDADAMHDDDEFTKGKWEPVDPRNASLSIPPSEKSLETTSNTNDMPPPPPPPPVSSLASSFSPFSIFSSVPSPFSSTYSPFDGESWTPTTSEGTQQTPISIDDAGDNQQQEPMETSGNLISTSLYHYPNNNQTMALFRFRNYGNKMVENNTKRRLYYKCTHKECPATYHTTGSLSPEKKNDKYKAPSNNNNNTIVFSNDHNHEPPPNPRTRPEVKEKALSQMSAGATPSNVHAEFVRNASLPLSSADVPTLAQLKNWKHEFSMKDMPTGDVLENIILKHGRTFVRECKVHPTIHVAMVSDFGADLLSKSDYVICDGTFNTTECKLVLTTILGFHEGIAIPCAYLLSNSKETDNYESFYRTVKKTTKGIMSPKGVLLDFEEALSEGFVKVFPEAAVLADFFHFVQANVKAVQKLGFKSRSKDVVKGLQSLWYALTRYDFDIALVEFLQTWDREIPAYATYFRRNWLERYHPEKWASYARADNAPSGSGSAEGFHNRLNHNMPRGAMSLDKMVDYLVSEDEYWKRVVGDPRLWAEKKAAHASSQDKHRRKRRMLKYYVERGNDPERSDQVDTRSISSDLLSSDGDEGDMIEDDLSSSSSLTTTTTTTTSTTMSTSNDGRPHKQRKQRKPNPTIPMHERCLKCRLYKFNDQCSLTMCKSCCISSPSPCKYTHHRQAKIGARQPITIASQTLVQDPPNTTSTTTTTITLPVSDIKERLEAIIQAKRDVYISYDKGTNSNRPRKIKPNSFSPGKEGELVQAYCYIAKDRRSFCLHRIIRMEDHNWESDSNSNNNSDSIPPTPVTVPSSLPSKEKGNTVPASVEEWINNIGMSQYWDKLRNNGFDTFETIIELDDSVLDALKITMLGHRKRLMRMVGELSKKLQ